MIQAANTGHTLRSTSLAGEDESFFLHLLQPGAYIWIALLVEMIARTR